MVQVAYTEIDNGYKGTVATIQKMAQFAFKGSLDWRIIKVARVIIRDSGIDPRDEKQIGDTIFIWMKDNVSFVRDPHDGELVQYPYVTLSEGFGDCDDHSVLFCALVSAVGCRSRFVTIGVSKENFSHVYSQVFYPKENKWIPYDTVVPESYPGWEAKKYGVKTVWRVGKGKLDDLSDVRNSEKLMEDKEKRAELLKNRMVFDQPVKAESPFLTRDDGVLYIMKMYPSIENGEDTLYLISPNEEENRGWEDSLIEKLNLNYNDFIGKDYI